MPRQVLQPESPQLFVKMAFDWVSVLVQSLQVPEYPQETVPPGADCFTVHEHTNKTVPESGHPESRESNVKIASTGPRSREGCLAGCVSDTLNRGLQHEQLLLFH